MKEMYITQFHVKGMWRRINLRWDNIHDDVNILVGINGCGKTTLLNLMADFYAGNKNKTKELAEDIYGTETETPITYIRSFDVPAKDRRKTESFLLQELKSVINQNGNGTSFFDYRMRMLNFPEQAEMIRMRIEHFFTTVDSLFGETGKKIAIDPTSNTLVFRIGDGSSASHDDMILLEQLSSGEKQMLLILTTVFLQEEKPNILLMDEPEISLHIGWQDRLISLIRKLNPQCQLILTTHSPNIFADGWEDKIVFMNDLVVK